MSLSRSPAAVDQKWSNRYEQLRGIVLAGSADGGWGRALLCRRGVAAWMRAWVSQDSAAPEAPERSASTNGRKPLGLPVSLREPLVHILATMIFESERTLSV